MKYLLTSGGISNPSITAALEQLLGKPISRSDALLVPTGMYPFPGGGVGAREAVIGTAAPPLASLGWRSLGILELTALPTLREDAWLPALRSADALCVWGGDVLYLVHWMRESGLADLIPTLEDIVYVGVSAGSIAVTPHNCDAEFDRQFVPEGGDMGRDAETALGLVDVTLVPHLDHPEMPGVTRKVVERWAADIPVPVYAMDDDTALRIVDGQVEVISEGRWHRMEPRQD